MSTSALPRRDRGAANSAALGWIAAVLAVTTVVAGLGWAGVIGGGEEAAPSTTTTSIVSTTTTTIAAPTEWPAAATGEILLYGCPAGEVVGHVVAGDSVTVIGRAEGNAWVAINDPIDPSVTVWLLASALAPDTASPAWGDLPLVPCQIDSAEPVQYFRGKVVDSVTGVPLAGVSVTPTDDAGAPLTPYTVVSAADGSYEITGVVDSAYGIWVDGAAAGYEQGFTGAAVGPLGFVVWPTWGEAATAAPGTIGDIALDSTGVPATTLPGGSVPPTTLLAGPNMPPVIGTLTANPGTIYSKPSTPGLCKTTSAILSVDVTDASGVASVTVDWSYRSFSGTITLARLDGSDTWQGKIENLPDPTNPVAVSLVVTATDAEGLAAALPFGQSLGLKKCG